MTARAPRDRFPSSIKYLAWNEAAERYSYYGMTSILALHMARNLGIPENESEAYFHVFTFGVYFMPVVGAWLADRFWGRYRTILWLSFGYVAGHATLALWESGAGLVAGLALIAVGAGGIKPCASAFAGDQIPPEKEGLLARLYDLYYWMINLGSTLGTLTIPLLLDHVGPRVAFGVPGLAMAVALAIFWAGRRRYLLVPPAAARAAAPAPGAPAGEAPGSGAGTVLLRIVAVFAPVSVFWALFFQYGSSWTLQADRMRRDVRGYVIPAGQVQTLDAALVLTLIPLFATVVYPAFERAGVRVTALRKMTVGMFVTTLSFVAAAAVQAALDAGGAPHVAWQIPQYFFLVVGEVLVSVTALEFAYSQAPARMKSLVMGLWYLTIASGSFLTAVVAWLNRFQGVAYFVFFAALMLVAAVVFALVAWWYPVSAARRSGEAA
ncbi:MAG TPA: POT family MFS transporter [Anaeromyxobacteraceae bacterium]|nr:POT family MFS transporter [Anaeromyxobacteraceae bacterium]